MDHTTPPRRICIVGTAPTWRDAPWDDPGVEFWLLNDMYVLQPKRADRWFDLHPPSKMHFHKGKRLAAHQVPAGYFVRPEGHLQWLAQQTIPVYLQQATPSIPASRTFPRAEVEAAVGPYFASSPAWMVGLALLEGVTELHIYGIHLATEWEYVKQKPNLMFLLGLAAGRGVKLVLPTTAPLLRESHRYAYEDDPDLPRVAAERRVLALQDERARVAAKQKRRWYQRRDPNVASRLSWLDAQITDAKLGAQFAQMSHAPTGW